MIQQFYPQINHDYLFELNKDFHFAAAHYLPNEKAGKCSDIHGHTYFVNVTVAGDELDELGMLINFSDIKKLIHGKFDHAVINDEISMPSTEKVAEFIFNELSNYVKDLLHNPKILQVMVRETPTSYVLYRGKR